MARKRDITRQFAGRIVGDMISKLEGRRSELLAQSSEIEAALSAIESNLAECRLAKAKIGEPGRGYHDIQEGGLSHRILTVIPYGEPISRQEIAKLLYDTFRIAGDTKYLGQYLGTLIGKGLIRRTARGTYVRVRDIIEEVMTSAETVKQAIQQG